MVFRRTTPVSAQGLSLNHRSMKERLHKVAEQLNKTAKTRCGISRLTRTHQRSRTVPRRRSSSYEEVHGWELNRYTQLGSLPRLNAGNYVESNTSGSDGHRVIYGFTLVGTEVEIAWRAGTSSETSGYGATQICRASGRTTRFVAPSLRHTTYCQMRLTTDDLLECLG
jgi:hypothetical protein